MGDTLFHHITHFDSCRLENLPNKCKRDIIVFYITLTYYLRFKSFLYNEYLLLIYIESS